MKLEDITYYVENQRFIRKQIWGMNPERFSKLFTDTSRSKIASYEYKTNPPIRFLLELHQLTGISIEDFYLRRLERTDVPEKPLSNWSKYEDTTAKKEISEFESKRYKELMEQVLENKRFIEEILKDRKDK